MIPGGKGEFLVKSSFGEIKILDKNFNTLFELTEATVPKTQLSSKKQVCKINNKVTDLPFSRKCQVAVKKAGPSITLVIIQHEKLIELTFPLTLTSQPAPEETTATELKLS